MSRHGPRQKHQKSVLTVSASLVPGDAGGGASGTHCAIAEVGVGGGAHCQGVRVSVPMPQSPPPPCKNVFHTGHVKGHGSGPAPCIAHACSSRPAGIHVSAPAVLV